MRKSKTYVSLGVLLVLCIMVSLNVQDGSLLLVTSAFRQTNNRAGASPRIAILNIVNQKLDFSKFELAQLSAVRNAIFAALHGYLYVLVEDESMVGGRHEGLWAKPRNIPSVLKDFDLVVQMDFDVYINDLTMSFERLFDHWGFTPEHELLMALDPDKPYNHVQLANGTSILNLNTGFMVVRNTPSMATLWAEWNTYRDSGHDDQRAFNIHIREKVPTDKLLILSCKEANGGDPAWNNEDPTCAGIHLQHAWLGKDYIKTLVQKQILENMLLTLPVQRREGAPY